jgi:chromosome segregation ATPase
MNVEDKIKELEIAIEHLRRDVTNVEMVNENRYTMYSAIADRLDYLNSRMNKAEELASKRLQEIFDRFETIGDKLWRTYEKVFPGILKAEAEAQGILDKIVAQSAKKPKS